MEQHTMTLSDIKDLAAKLAVDPAVARLALATAWHPDFTDAQLRLLKDEIRRCQG